MSQARSTEASALASSALAVITGPVWPEVDRRCSRPMTRDEEIPRAPPAALLFESGSKKLGRPFDTPERGAGDQPVPDGAKPAENSALGAR
jgi:hypothetical protein